MGSDIQARGVAQREDDRAIVNFTKFVLVGVVNTAFGYAINRYFVFGRSR